MYVHINIFICIHIYINIFICIHIYTHTHTHLVLDIVAERDGQRHQVVHQLIIRHLHRKLL